MNLKKHITCSRANRAVATAVGSVSQYPAAADEVAGVAVAGGGRTGPATRSLFRRAAAAAGLYGAEETAGRTSQSPAKGTQGGIRRTDRATSGDTGGVRHRVRIFARSKDAHPVEGDCATGLGRPAARLAGNGRRIQITPQ